MELIFEGTPTNEKYIIGDSFYKIPRGEPSKIFQFLAPIDRLVFGCLKSYTPFYSYREGIKETPGDNIEKEIKTLKLWKQYGVKAPKILSWEDGILQIEHIPNSQNYTSVFQTSNKGINQLLELYHQIRELALNNNNPDLFHSDPHLRNFLFDDEQAYAIDPGVIICPKLDIQGVDTHLNLFFLYDFIKSGTHPDIANEAVKSFSKSQRNKIKDLNKRFTKKSLGLLMWTLRTEMVRRLKGNDKVASFRQHCQTLEKNAIKILTWGGLRGGISIALALSLPQTPIRDTILTITYIVVIFSILIQGMSLKYLIKNK